ncbi:MAG: anti-sigma factor family protein [Tepidisphaeraceae bacterium]
MNCPTEQLLTAYLDGELTPEQAADVQRHIAACDACATLVGTWVQLGDALRDARLEKPSLAAQSRWMDAVSLATDRSVRRLAGWMTVAASVVLVVTMLMSSQSSAQATPALADWEAAAINGPDTSNDSVHATAQMLAVDLSLPSQSEGSR